MLYKSHFETTWSSDELMRNKMNILRQLGELAKNNNIKLSQNYNMQSDYKVMKSELDLYV